jgi:hypothetical protein
MSEVLRFEFQGERDARELEGDLGLAILCAECIYGRPRVRMEISYVVDPSGKAAVLETCGEAGDAAARMFAGLVGARLGEESYQVRRLRSTEPRAGVKQ